MFYPPTAGDTKEAVKDAAEKYGATATEGVIVRYRDAYKLTDAAKGQKKRKLLQKLFLVSDKMPPAII